jgi:hypothetical protein
LGYETRIELYDVKVRRDDLEAVAEAIAAVAGGATSDPHWMVGLLKLENDGSLSWDESSQGKWKTHEEFIKWLAARCERGFVAFWSCEGDGATWAYEFDGAGGYSECSARRVSALRAGATRKRRATAAKAAQTKKRRAAGANAALTRKRRAAGRKAAETRRRNVAGAESTALQKRMEAEFAGDLDTYMAEWEKSLKSHMTGNDDAPRSA